MTDRQRLPADVRKQQILEGAFRYARSIGYDNLTRDGVAEYTNVSTGQVTRVFGNIENLRAEVIAYAVKAAEGGDDTKQTLTIVARGMMIGNKDACGAKRAIKNAAMKAVV